MDYKGEWGGGDPGHSWDLKWHEGSECHLGPGVSRAPSPPLTQVIHSPLGNLLYTGPSEWVRGRKLAALGLLLSGLAGQWGWSKNMFGNVSRSKSKKFSVSFLIILCYRCTVHYFCTAYPFLFISLCC